MSVTGLIILAAGASTRLGHPKQLLPYKGTNLLITTIENALASVCQPIVVVLGAYAEQIEPEIGTLPIDIIVNEQWATGMGTSIQKGLSWLESAESLLHSVALMVCDQPFVSFHLINQLVDTYLSTQKDIVVSEYAGTVGVPALFSSRLFPELKALERQGAKSIIMQHREDVISVPFLQGDIDIDTSDDVQRWLSHTVLHRDSAP